MMGNNPISILPRLVQQKAESVSEIRIPVLGILIRMFLGLKDPDPLVRGTDPVQDPSLFS
jgi:hypothetical protein